MKFMLKPTKSQGGSQLLQILGITTASLAGFSDGLLFAWTSPSIPELLNTTDITLDQASYFTVLSPIGMLITAPIFPLLIDAIGRKNGVLFMAVPQLLVWILTGLAGNTLWVFYLARFLSGISTSAMFATLPPYVAEIAEPKVRGSWGNLASIGYYFGLFIVNVIGAYNDIPTTALICGCVPILQVLLFALMPETPYYLLMKGKEEKAKKSLQLLRWKTDVDQELTSLKADVQRQASESGTFKDLFTIESNRKALLICVGLRFGQLFSGLTTFEQYTQYMFQQAGGSVPEKISAMIFTALLAASTALSSFVIDRLGRKPMLTFTSIICGVILTIETIYFALDSLTSLELSHFRLLPLLGMLAFIVICGTGPAILPTLIQGEIFSTSIKGKAGFVLNMWMAVCVLIVPKLFESLTHSIGLFAPFTLFSVCCFVSAAISHFCLLETKGKTLESIQQELKGNTGMNTILCTSNK